MTADLEAVTRDKLARWLLDFRYEGRVGWEELGDETHELLRGKADQVAAVLASLPDDRLAEAEAKAWDEGRQSLHADMSRETDTGVWTPTANPYRAALSAGEAP